MREIKADPGTPRPSKAPRKRDGLVRRVLRFPHWGAVRRYGTRAVLWPAFAVLMGGVVVNATAFQKGRHPAPLVNIPDPGPAAAAPVQRASIDDDPVASTPAPRAAEPAPAAPQAQPPARRDGVAQGARNGARDPRDGPARKAAARVGPGQPHAPPKAADAVPHAKPGDRDRLAAMMGAASKGRASVAN